MSTRSSVLGVVCLLATACGGHGGEEGATSQTTTGSERAVLIDARTGEPIARIEATEEEAQIPYREAADDETLGGLSRTGTAIVQDEDDATWETPLPATADPLDEPERSIRVSTREICPADLEGLVASFEALPRGGAMVLTADAGEVDDLRARVSRFAHAQQQARAAEVRDDDERPGTVRFRDEDSELLEATSVRVVDIEGGARLEVETNYAGDIPALRSAVRDSADALGQGRCPLALQIRA
ncbi:hypothetical protein [Sandaracinus amylolyticus]|uniref:hypothetical protein n=1 Tax=Sandaracinus amylolyticus TaxID=927083 RepID=UPI001F2A3632|nr:hypothetical protein [Sandaracinus amylolyticus]UJR84587.1 Hypothetical protein I5071_66660 [Sandaracinus amylolyticus]